MKSLLVATKYVVLAAFVSVLSLFFAVRGNYLVARLVTDDPALSSIRGRFHPTQTKNASPTIISRCALQT